jgi:hypothetical protein
VQVRIALMLDPTWVIGTMHFKSFVFERDKERTEEQETLLQRPVLIGVLLFLISVVFMILELIGLAIFFLLTGVTTYNIARWRKFKAKDVGRRPASLEITDEHILLNQEKFNLNELEDLFLEIIDCEREISGSMYSMAQGTTNSMSFKFQGKPIHFNFYIGNLRHYNDLIEFCEERGIAHKARKSWL